MRTSQGAPGGTPEGRRRPFPAQEPPEEATFRDVRGCTLKYAGQKKASSIFLPRRFDRFREPKRIPLVVRVTINHTSQRKNRRTVKKRENIYFYCRMRRQTQT